jgi:hypothetical protein
MVNVLFRNLPSKKGMSYVTCPVRERVKVLAREDVHPMDPFQGQNQINKEKV